MTDSLAHRNNSSETAAESRKRLVAVIAAGMVLPPLMLAELWANRSDKYKQWLITAFFVVFGATMIVGQGDAYRHLMRVEFLYSNMPFSLFLEDLWRMLTFRLTESGSREPYIFILSYFFGGVVGLPQLFFPFVAGVYGYFFGGSILHVLRHFKLSKTNYVLLALVILFVLMQSLGGVQTVRTWTGAWVLVYACLKYHETRSLKYLLLMFVPPFIHFGFWMMAIPAWIVLVFGSRPLVYSTVFVLSTFTNFLPAESVMGQLSRTERGESSVVAYRQDEQVIAIEEFEGLRETTNFYNAYRRAGFHRWAPTILALTLILTGIYQRGMSLYQRRILSIGIVTLAFSNMTWFLFAVHNRTLTIASLFIVAAFLMARFDPKTAHCFRGQPPYYQWGVHLAVLLFIPYILFVVSLMFDRLSAFMLAAPLLVFFDPELNTSMKDFLNFLLGRG
ncbi:MAG: hypothetical protein ACXIUB_05655 [Wenzhouxiangella sp.]